MATTPPTTSADFYLISPRGRDKLAHQWPYIQSAVKGLRPYFESGWFVEGESDWDSHLRGISLSGSDQRRHDFRIFADKDHFYVQRNTGTESEPDWTTSFTTGVGGTFGSLDHGALSGLSDDDHPQYARKAAPWSTFTGAITAEAFYTASGGDLSATPPSDHGGLTGLGDDDHTQYLLVSGGRAATGAFTFNSTVTTSGSVTAPSFYTDNHGEVLGHLVDVTDGVNDYPFPSQLNFNANEFYVTSDLAGDPVINLQPSSSAPYAYLAGFVLSNGTDATNDINISKGVGRSDDDTRTLRTTGTFTKQIDAAWTAGSDAGGFPSGLTLTNDTWYHVFAISHKTNFGVDFGFDTSLTAANLLADATNYTGARRLGSIRYGTATIMGFSQFGDEFLWNSPPQDVQDADPATTATLATLLVPVGVRVWAKFDATLQLNESTGQGEDDSAVWITSPDQDDEAPGNTMPNVKATVVCIAGTNDVNDGAGGTASCLVRTNTSSQIRYRANTDASQTGYDFQIYTHGWVDNRGKDG